jgi:hypothetical protein
MFLRIALLKSAKVRMSEDGVKSVMYSRLALEFKPLYTWVYVAAKEAKYMEVSSCLLNVI